MTKKEKILETAQKLFSEQGFNSVTTKLLAKESQCNEVTIFRLFKSKNGILTEIISKFINETNILEILKQNLIGDLEKDIETTIRLYYDFLKKNEVIFRIQLKLSDSDSEKYVRSIDYKNYTINHFDNLFQTKLIKISSEIFITQMLSTIIGFFLFSIQTNKKFCKISSETFLNSTVILFQSILNIKDEALN